MSETIPEGLVTTSRITLSSGLQNPDSIDIDDIAHLWKVYHTIPSVHGNHIGTRLEYLFWRIWGSRRIHGTLRGSTVTSLFLRVSQTGPCSFPVRQQEPVGESRHGNHEEQTQGGESSASTVKHSEQVQVQEPQPQNLSHTATRKTAAPRPSILKKPMGASQDILQKNARLPGDSPGDQSITRKPSNTPTSPKPPVGDQSSRQGKKKTQFVASTKAGTKRRPPLVRRKSSQSSSTSITSATVRSPQKSSASSELPSSSTSKFPSIDPYEKADERLIPNPGTISPESFNSEGPKEMSSATLSACQVIMNSEDRPASPKQTPPQNPSITLGFSRDNAHRIEPKGLPPQQKPHERQPSSASLVEKDFRARFAEKRRTTAILAGPSNLRASMNPDLASRHAGLSRSENSDSSLTAALKSNNLDRPNPSSVQTGSMSLSPCPSTVRAVTPSETGNHSAGESHASSSTLTHEDIQRLSIQPPT